MSYIDSICGCCKKRRDIHTRVHIYTHASALTHTPYTHAELGRKKKLKSERQDNNKKEAGAFLDSEPSAAVKTMFFKDSSRLNI